MKTEQSRRIHRIPQHFEEFKKNVAEVDKTKRRRKYDSTVVNVTNQLLNQQLTQQ